jgi:hypothetical protein
MSEKRVGIIAEGKTDFPIIKGALKAILPNNNFVFTHIQPSEADLLGQTVNTSGFGWAGVYYACNNLSERLELQYLAGTEFDFLVIHIDADVMDASYGEANIVPRKNDLPCYDASNSIDNNCIIVENIVINWLGGVVPFNTALCIPCINTDVWAAFILFPSIRDQLTDSLTKAELEHKLLSMPADSRMLRMKSGKINKNFARYEQASSNLEQNLWIELCNQYSQAKRFTQRIQEINLTSRLS